MNSATTDISTQSRRLHTLSLLARGIETMLGWTVKSLSAGGFGVLITNETPSIEMPLLVMPPKVQVKSKLMSLHRERNVLRKRICTYKLRGSGQSVTFEKRNALAWKLKTHKNKVLGSLNRNKLDSWAEEQNSTLVQPVLPSARNCSAQPMKTKIPSYLGAMRLDQGRSNWLKRPMHPVRPMSAP